MLKKIVIPMISILVVYGSALYAEEASEQEQAVYGEEAPERVKRYSGTARKAPQGAYPWIVKLKDESGSFSGFLIAQKYVLTAAHALEKYKDGRCLRVFFNNAKKTYSGTVKARRYVLHPDYDNLETVEAVNDIAVVELNGPMMTPSIVKSIPELNTEHYNCKQVSPRSKGLEPISAGYADGDVLLKMKLKWGYGAVNKLGDCRSNHDEEPGLYMLRSRVKYHNNQGRMDSGDSGSPLFYQDTEGRTKVLGVAVSGGNAMDFEPVVKHLPFIKSATGMTALDEVEGSLKPLDWKNVECNEDNWSREMELISSSSP